MLPLTDTFVYLDGKILLHAVLSKKILPRNATVAQLIRHYRETQHIFIHQLAQMTCISRYALMDYEADKLFDDYYRFMAYPFSAKVRQTRKTLKLTQSEFGALLNVGRRAVERWEKGKTQVTRKVWERMKGKGLV